MMSALELSLYNPHVLADTTNIENAIMPPPRGAMGPARNRRRLNWPVPIAFGGGSAEAAWKFYFLIKKEGTGRCKTPTGGCPWLSYGILP